MTGDAITKTGHLLVGTPTPLWACHAPDRNSFAFQFAAPTGRRSGLVRNLGHQLVGSPTVLWTCHAPARNSIASQFAAATGRRRSLVRREINQGRITDQLRTMCIIELRRAIDEDRQEITWVKGMLKCCVGRASDMVGQDSADIVSQVPTDRVGHGFADTDGSSPTSLDPLTKDTAPTDDRSTDGVCCNFRSGDILACIGLGLTVHSLGIHMLNVLQQECSRNCFGALFATIEVEGAISGMVVSKCGITPIELPGDQIPHPYKFQGWGSQQPSTSLEPMSFPPSKAGASLSCPKKLVLSLSLLDLALRE
eukprot:Gb_40134 [translate_table: standard]